MQTIYIHKRNLISTLFLGILIFFVSSCGTTNNGYGETDGIYSTDTTTEAATTTESNQKANYYKQYFESKNKAYEELPEEDVIFTDIEAYSTTETINEDGYIIVEEAPYDDDYGAWGTNSGDISINFYGGYGHSYYNPFYYGYPYYWGIGFYWGYPYYGWGYPYYGYGWGYPYYGYGGYYGGYYPYYGYNNVSYNRGRRNTDYYAGRTAATRGTTTGRNSYTRSEATRRTGTNSFRSSSYANSRSDNTPRLNSSANRYRTNSSRSENSNSFRNNTPTRSYNNTSRPSSSYRSSGSSGSSMRSSGGGMRSSGGSRGGGGGRRGGGLN